MPSYIEVFAGCGGLSTGLHKAGWEPILLVDNDRACIDTLKANNPELDAANGIRKEDVTKLHLTDYHRGLDLLVSGAPCQAWSQSGKRGGLEDERGNLFLDTIRLIDECEPKIFVIENVVGLLTHQKGATFRGLLDKMQVTETGRVRYHVQYKVLNANDYGVAQKRKRVIIVGERIDSQSTEPYESVYEYPSPLEYKPVLRDALRDVPESVGTAYPARKAEVLRLVPPGGCWVDLPQDIKVAYMGKSLESGGGKRGVARRLAWDEPSLTLTTAPCQKQTERCHPDETRPLTVREYARIQTFPDSYIFKGSITNQYKQIGNAVPVELAYHIGLSLLKAHDSASIHTRR